MMKQALLALSLALSPRALAGSEPPGGAQEPASAPTSPTLPAPRPLFPSPAQSQLPRGLYGYSAALATGRVALGLAPIVAFEPSMRLLGFPPEHDNPSARLTTRLFGVRDIGLGVLTMASTQDPESLRRAYLFNAAIDLADASLIAVPLLRDEGIDQAAALSLGFALGGCSAWLVGTWWLRRAEKRQAIHD
ncbi:MAG: DUF4267 domain-containing protein [Alphaproteobacteria bacterium]|nr:DUF4267 domain-containing protein [Alphaproteobacteria bacterium]